MRYGLSRLIGGLLISGMATMPAAAMDLTGTWVGSVKCTTFSGAKKKVSNPVTALITHDGTALNVKILGGGGLYSGIAIENVDDASQGEAGFVSCGTSDSIAACGSIIRGQAFTDPGKIGSNRDKLKLTETSLCGTDGSVGTCKYLVRRFSAANPEVSVCP